MTSSPSPSRGRGTALARAETSARTLVGLHRVNAQLQQELDKIDRQAFTAVSNIANHQQAMKMSWRRLEAQRNSPKTRARSRSSSDQPSPAPHRAMLSSNKTKLFVSATPQIYCASQQLLTGHEDEEASMEDRGTAPARVQDDVGISATRSSSGLSSGHRGLHMSSSPYISSPYMYRRDADAGLKPEVAVACPQPVSPLANTATSPPVKLPPILSSSSQPSLVATTNKDTLLKVSHIMGLDARSHGPKGFHGFYTDRALARYGAVGMNQVEDHPVSGEVGDRGREEEGKEEEESGGGELTLAQQFDQIRHCRYIRHYRPDGTAVEEPYGYEHDQ